MYILPFLAWRPRKETNRNRGWERACLVVLSPCPLAWISGCLQALLQASCTKLYLGGGVCSCKEMQGILTAVIIKAMPYNVISSIFWWQFWPPSCLLFFVLETGWSENSSLVISLMLMLLDEWSKHRVNACVQPLVGILGNARLDLECCLEWACSLDSQDDNKAELSLWNSDRNFIYLDMMWPFYV